MVLAGGVLDILIMSLDQVFLEGLQFWLEKRDQMSAQIWSACVLFYLKHIFIIILVVDELRNRDQDQSGRFGIVRDLDGKDKLQVVYTKSLTLTLGDVAITNDAGDSLDSEQSTWTGISWNSNNVLRHVIFWPPEAVFIYPVPETWS